MGDELRDEDAMWLAWQRAAPSIYDEIYYRQNPLVAYFSRAGHVEAERPFSPGDSFPRVVEVGAGTGEHVAYVKHQYDAYYVTDLNSELLERARQRHPENGRLRFEVQDALALGYPDATFDRLISVYNLEHLPNPHRAIREWRRVVRPGGTITISIPTEGGIAWNMGRYLTTRRSFRAKGLDLDYIIAREHINACYRLVSFLEHYFPRRRVSWFPFRIPSPHLNLVFTCTAVNE